MRLLALFGLGLWASSAFGAGGVFDITKVLGATRSSASTHLSERLGAAPRWVTSQNSADGSVRSMTTMCSYKSVKVGSVEASIDVLLDRNGAKVESVNLNTPEGKLSWQRQFEVVGLRAAGVKVSVLVQMDGMKVTRFTNIPDTPKGFNARLMQRNGVRDSLTFALK